MKNSADRGGCYAPQPITPSSICRILHILPKPNSIIANYIINYNDDDYVIMMTIIPKAQSHL